MWYSHELPPIYTNLIEESQLNEFEFLYLDHLPQISRTEENFEDKIFYSGFIQQKPSWHMFNDYHTISHDLYRPVNYSYRKIKNVSIDNIPASTNIQIIHFNLPTNTLNLLKDEQLILDFVQKIKQKPNIKIVFSNLWDIYGTTFIKDNKHINVIEWLCNIVKPIEHQLFFFVANVYVVNHIKNILPNSNVLYSNVYFRRIQSANNSFTANKNQRSKHFICLNHLTKKHRTTIFNLLSDPYSYKSYVSQGIILDDVDEGWSWQDKLLPEHNNSYINIVTESLFDRLKYHQTLSFYQRGFVTEKTMKCIWAEQLPLLVSTPHIHKDLKDIGFLLPEDFINYEFDTEEDDDKRLSLICNEIQRLQCIDLKVINKYYNSDQCQQQFKHNKDLFKKLCRQNLNSYIMSKCNG